MYYITTAVTNLLVGVGGLVSVPALNHDIHDVLVAVKSSRFTSSDTNTQVRGVKAGLNGLVEGESHGSLYVGVLGI